MLKPQASGLLRRCTCSEGPFLPPPLRLLPVNGEGESPPGPARRQGRHEYRLAWGFPAPCTVSGLVGSLLAHTHFLLGTF